MDRLPRTYLLVAAALLGMLLLARGAAVAGATEPSFVDPTARVVHRANVHLGSLVYVAPFARLLAGNSPENGVWVGDESNLQDSVVADASGGAVRLGEQALVAHGAVVRGRAALGEQGRCADGASHCPSFVGFNAQVDGAVVDKDAMVLTLARVGPGVHLPSG